MTRTRRPAWVIVGRAVDLNLDPNGGPWVTVCDRHGFVMNHVTKALAISWARSPEDWCDECGGIAPLDWAATA